METEMDNRELELIAEEVAKAEEKRLAEVALIARPESQEALREVKEAE